MRIKIVKSASCVKFPYGCASNDDKEFVSEHIGEVFDGVRANMNYYVLNNGVSVHVYNAQEVDA